MYEVKHICTVFQRARFGKCSPPFGVSQHEMYMLGSNYPNVLKGRVLNKNNNYGLLAQSVCATHAYIISDVLMKDSCNRCLLIIPVKHRLYLHSRVFHDGIKFTF